jgi:hypothetical protein
MQALGVAGAMAQTQSLVLATNPQPIFEAGFKVDTAGSESNGGALAFADVLLPEAGGVME